MPSQQDPSDIETGPGKLPIDVATAATNLFAISSSSILNSLTDLSNREIAISSVSDSGTGPTASIILNSGDGPFFVGDSGADELKDLFRPVDINTDAEIFNPVTKLYVRVTAISPATVGSGFYSGALTLTLSTPIPTGVSYYVFYGRRTTLGEIPPDATTFPMIRRSADRVRFPEVARTGLAPTSVAEPLDIVLNGYLDPLMAQWKSVLRGPQYNFMPAPNFGGSIGFVNLGRKKNANDADDQGLTGHQGAGFLNAYVKEIIGTGTIAGANPLTRINPALSALAISGSVVELAVTDFFRTATSSALRPGIDMLEITRASGRVETYIITEFDVANVRRATIRSLGGALANLNVAEVITCRWIRPSFFLGGDNDFVTVTGSERMHFRGFANLTSGPITDNSAAEIVQEPPFFGAARSSLSGADSARGYWDLVAFRWGGFNIEDSTVSEIGRRDVRGELWGDGSIESYGGRIRGILGRRSDTRDVTVTETFTWNPNLNALQVFRAISASVIVETVAVASSYIPQDGDTIEFFLDYRTSGINTTFVFPVNFKFSGSDGATPLVIGTKAKFVGTYHDGDFFFTRTDYV